MRVTNSFDLALCSHFLFLYSDQLSKQFYVQAIREMCRGASEVRIFPSIALDNRTSPHVSDGLAQLNPLCKSSILEKRLNTRERRLSDRLHS